MEKDALVTQKLIAEMLNKSDRQVRNYEDIPKTNDNPPKYPVRAVMFWAITKGIVDFEIPKIDKNAEDLPPNIRKDLADARLKEFKLAELEGEYMRKEEIKAKAERILIAFRNRTLAMPSKIAPAVLGIENTEEAKAILDDAVYELLTELSELEGL